MTQPRHTSLSLRTQVVSLHEGLATTDATDYFANERLSQQVASLKSQLERDGYTEAGVLGGVALRVAELIQSGREIGPEEAQELLRSISSGIASCVGVEVKVAAAAQPESAAVAPPERPQLKMVTNRKLGEMLVQMSLLTPQQVEQALAHQRMTGCRLGEALIEMRVLPKMTVENVLRIQGTRRQTSNDPWRAVS